MIADTLKIMTCGSVDDGKSTLIGRILYESNNVFEDQLATLKDESQKHGTVKDDLDFALLVDGLSAEREQGITIDVAYRYFSLGERRIIMADTPGHVQYTRNMATAASNSELAIILIDASKGVLPQTKRHSFIVSLLGVKHVVIAVNKMDMVEYDQKQYEDIVKSYTSFAQKLDFDTMKFIPLSALKGDNLIKPSDNMSWYTEETLVDYLKSVKVEETKDSDNFRLPVQMVCRPDSSFRGFAGTVNGGTLQQGDQIQVLPSGKKSTVKSIVTYDKDLKQADAGQAITLTLEDEIDISRGDVICAVDEDKACEVSDILKADILWMSEKPMVSGRQYIYMSQSFETICTIGELEYVYDIHDTEKLSAKNLSVNDIGGCQVYLNHRAAFDPYKKNKAMGSFIIVDRYTNMTVAMGMVQHGLRRAHNIHPHELTITKAERSELKNQKPCVLWMTGLSGAGKSTIANILEKKLHVAHKHSILLDGDNVRKGLNKDLGFTEQDRAENIRRIAEVSNLMVEAGLITIVSFISPFRAERQMAKEIIGVENFIEVYIDTPLEEAERRDVKGLYKKARAGEIPNFTGIGSPYEVPENPDVSLNTVQYSAEELAEQLEDYLKGL